MEDLAQRMQEVTLNNFEPGSRTWVHVTHIIDPSNFYIRPITYDRYISDVSARGDAVQKADLQLGSRIVFKSRLLKNYTRGSIHRIDDNNDDSPRYDLMAIDEGFLEKAVKLKHIYRVMDQNNMPPLAVHCELADCVPLGTAWTEREIDAMKFYVGKEKALMTIKENSQEALVVVLENSNPDDIAKLMALTGYSRMGFKHKMVGRLTVPAPAKNFFKYREPKVGEVLKVRLQYGTELNEFFVAKKDDYKVYLEEQSNYTYFTRQLKWLTSEDLKVDLPVGVYIISKNVYERGLVQELISENRARVQLIDWGNINEYNIDLLKPMSEKFFHNPAIAMYCTLEGDEIYDHRLKKYLYPGYEFMIEIIETGYGFSKPNVVKILPIK